MLQLELAQRCWASPPEHKGQLNTRLCLRGGFCVYVSSPIRMGCGIADTSSSSHSRVEAIEELSLQAPLRDPLLTAGRRLPIWEAAPDFPLAWAQVQTPAVPHIAQHHTATRLLDKQEST